MGNKYWDHQRDSKEEIDRHMKMLQEAKEFQEKRKKEDRERIEGIKRRWIRSNVLSDDISWLIMKAEKEVER